MSAVAATASHADEVFRLVRSRISGSLPPSALDPAFTPQTGDHSLNIWSISSDFLTQARPAAVLVGLVDYGDTVSVFLTQRTGTLRDHAGQIAFPGGKMDPDETSPAATALREANEETGLLARSIETLGYLDPYLTRTGFRIIPVVARLVPPLELRLNPAEVADAFEVPFGYLMQESNHRIQQREWMGHQRSFYSIEHGERTIWGVTAGILRILYERLYLP